jgi:hypothetical protein
MRPFAPLLALLTAASLSTPVAAAAQIGVDELVRTLATTDGKGSLVVTITNDGERRAEVEIDVNDWFVAEGGRHEFRPAGSLEGSCGERLRAAQRTVALEPGGSATIQVSYEGEAAESCRNIVFFRVAETPDGLGGERLIFSTGVKVYVEPRT